MYMWSVYMYMGYMQDTHRSVVYNGKLGITLIINKGFNR